MNYDKRQKAKVAAFVNAILDGGTTPIGIDEIFNTSLVTFKTLESIASSQNIHLRQ